MHRLTDQVSRRRALAALNTTLLMLAALPAAASAQGTGIGTGIGTATGTGTGGAPANCPALLQYTFARLQDEKPQPLCQYAGKVLLVVNTASFCGFTPQYTGLEALYSKYAQRGLVVLGFPSNDFGEQEPGNARQIAELCFNTYGVKFPMMAKTVVKGKDAHPLFVALSQATGKAPGWNFHKYLVDRQGKPLGSFASSVNPDNAALVAAVEKALAQP